MACGGESAVSASDHVLNFREQENGTQSTVQPQV